MSMKAVVSNNISISVSDAGDIIFQATILLPELTREELDAVLNTVDLKDGAVIVRLDKANT